jgi:hypothetical protein
VTPHVFPKTTACLISDGFARSQLRFLGSNQLPPIAKQALYCIAGLSEAKGVGGS